MAYPAARGTSAHTPYQSEADDAAAQGKLVQGMGAAVSLALIMGLGYWGYSLAVRDATGIPVVRALEGPMRVTPEDPGGQIAENTGLSVTQVAAEGTASAPPAEVAVAVEMTDLTSEDQPAAALRRPEPREGAQPAEAADAELVDPNAVTRAAVEDAPLPADPVAAALALAQRVSEGAEPLDAAQTPLAGAALAPEQTPRLVRSLRPTPRPAAPTRPAITEITEVRAQAAPAELAASAVPVGTRMVQLGAFDSPEEADTAWAVLSAQFDAIMQGKTRVVQEAASGGRAFYRLRAMGFADLSDARRFCAALVAERADCIPVVAR